MNHLGRKPSSPVFFGGGLAHRGSLASRWTACATSSASFRQQVDCVCYQGPAATRGQQMDSLCAIDRPPLSACLLFGRARWALHC